MPVLTPADAHGLLVRLMQHFFTCINLVVCSNVSDLSLIGTLLMMALLLRHVG